MTRRIAPLAARLLVVAACMATTVALAQGTTKKKEQRKAQRPAPAVVVAPLDLPAAAGEQVAAASLTFFGQYDCEFGETVVLTMNPTFDAYIDITHRKRVHTMKPVLSHTGAIRLEDVRGQMLMIQIASKSMLMDTQLGQRVVDGCQHERQRHHVAQAAPGEGIGIDPAKPIPVASTGVAAAPLATGGATPNAPSSPGTTPATTPATDVGASITVPPAAGAPSGPVALVPPAVAASAPAAAPPGAPARMTEPAPVSATEAAPAPTSNSAGTPPPAAPAAAPAPAAPAAVPAPASAS